MSKLNSTQRWNQRHGLPLDAGPKEQMLYIARTAEEQETKARAFHALNLLVGHNAKVLGMRSPSEADDFVQQRLEALEKAEENLAKVNEEIAAIEAARAALEVVPPDTRGPVQAPAVQDVQDQATAEKGQPRSFTPQSYHTEQTAALRGKYGNRNDKIRDLMDRKTKNEEILGEITDPKDREYMASHLEDRLLGDYGGVSFKGVEQVQRDLEAQDIPYVVERSDGGNLGGLNAHHGEVHETADVDVKKVWGEICAQQVTDYGGVIGRDQGDEMMVVWPNFTLAEVQEIRADIEQQMRNRAKELGLESVPHPEAWRLAHGRALHELWPCAGLERRR